MSMGRGRGPGRGGRGGGRGFGRGRGDDGPPDEVVGEFIRGAAIVDWHYCAPYLTNFFFPVVNRLQINGTIQIIRSPYNHTF